MMAVQVGGHAMKKLKNILKQFIAPLATIGAMMVCHCCSRGMLFNIMHTLRITDSWNMAKLFVQRIFSTKKGA